MQSLIKACSLSIWPFTLYMDHTQHMLALLMQDKLKAGLCLCKMHPWRFTPHAGVTQWCNTSILQFWSWYKLSPNEGFSFVQRCCAGPVRCTTQHAAWRKQLFCLQGCNNAQSTMSKTAQKENIYSKGNGCFTGQVWHNIFFLEGISRTQHWASSIVSKDFKSKSELCP